MALVLRLFLRDFMVNVASEVILMDQSGLFGGSFLMGVSG